MKRFKQFLNEKRSSFLSKDYYREFKIGDDGRIYFFDTPRDPDAPLDQEDWELFDPNEIVTAPNDLGVVYGLPGSGSMTPTDWNPPVEEPITLPGTQSNPQQ